MGVLDGSEADVGGQVSPSDLSEDCNWPAAAMVLLTVAFVTKAGERSIAAYGTTGVNHPCALKVDGAAAGWQS